MCSGERQNPTVSSEQLLSDLGEPQQSAHRARSTGTCTRCTTHTCASNGGCVSWEEGHDRRAKLSSSWLQRQRCDRCSQCGGGTSPVQTPSAALGADVFKNLACSEQNRRLSAMKYIYINRETSNIRFITHALGHRAGY